MPERLTLPLSDEDVLNLHVGDTLLINGILVTARDAAHKWLVDLFIDKTKEASFEELGVYAAIKPVLNYGSIYHCGPVVAGLQCGKYRFVSAGPTSSLREEPYQARIIHHFHLKAVIGKGGMGERTLRACQEEPAVYLHAVGGAAALLAERVVAVRNVHKLDFGVPEAMWVIEVANFPVVVTMDAHGNNLHDGVRQCSAAVLARLLEE